MKFTKIPENTFQTLQLNAGVLLSSFNPNSATATDANILGATSGGITFTATPSFIDFGEDIDNCPKNMKELKKLDSWDIKCSGSFATVSTALAARLSAAADVASEKVTPRVDLASADFSDLWIVGDYSDKNGETNGGFVAIHMINALSTGGFSIKTADKEKGKFDFEFTAHFSMSAQTTVPFEIYVHAGTDANGIALNKTNLELAVGANETLIASVYPAASSVTWASNDTDKATVTSGGKVAGVAAGYAVITASITVSDVTYTAACTVHVIPAS